MTALSCPFEEARQALPHSVSLSFSPVDDILRWPFRGRSSSASSYISLPLSCGRHLAMALSRQIVERFLILRLSPSLLWTTFCGGPFEEDRRALPHYTFLSLSPVDDILRWPFRGRSSSASSFCVSLLLSCGRHSAEDCFAWWRPPPHLTPPLPVSMWVGVQARVCVYE